MEFFLDANVAYLLLVGAVVFSALALMTPGTGVLEVSALFFILLAGYAVYNLSFNGWALVLLLLSFLPLFLALRRPPRRLWLILSLAGLTLGSTFFFPTQGRLLSVNPVLAAVTSLLLLGFLWISAQKVMQISQMRPVHDLSSLIGQRGETKTPLAPQGSVQVAGELWSARSERPIPRGRIVRVIGREGFTLLVEEETDRHSE